MSKYKAKKVFTMRGYWSNIVTYEYRGRHYDVEYANSIHYCVTPAWVQHKDAQERINNELDAPKVENTKTFTEQLDEVWELLGW